MRNPILFAELLVAHMTEERGYRMCDRNPT